MRDQTVLEIDLTAVSHNMAVLRRLVGPRVGLCPVVKADAYGLGAARIAPALMAAGAEMLAVYTPDQAAELFRAAVAGPVLVMMPVRGLSRGDELEHALVRSRLHLSVHDGDQLRDLVRLSERYTTPIPVHLDVDTGMSRGGCTTDEAPELLAAIVAAPRLTLAGISTHFAAAESDLQSTERQHQRFEEFLEQQGELIPASCLIHVANTAAAIRSRTFHRRMVRVGQAWAGYGPELMDEQDLLAGATDLRGSVTLTSQIIQVKSIPARTRVGYGGTWNARRASVIGLVPVGYADGYPLALSRRGSRSGTTQVAVLVEGGGGLYRRYANVVGRVNMDQITIDLTELVDDGETVRAGTPVEVISADRSAPNHLTSLAELAKTTPYEMLCRLSPRLKRYYRQAAPSVEVLPQKTLRKKKKGAAAAVAADGKKRPATTLASDVS